MQPILIFVVSAVGFAVTFLGVRGVLRSIFQTRALNPLGIALITAGILLFLLRAVTVAIPLLFLGIVVLSRKSAGPANKPLMQTSKVRSTYLEMTLDHDTGTIDGQILVGKRQGQILSTLSLSDLFVVYADVEADEKSVQLFETFLDFAHPEWRDQADSRSARDEGTPPPLSQLSRGDAYQLLGLDVGCSEEDIRKAYHRLIMRVHPDNGGSAALTTQITEARDRLLGDRQ
jgi:hypothetical protein